jgi:hypothetical protein
VFVSAVAADSCGNGNGQVQRGETILLDVTVANATTASMSSLVGHLTGPADVFMIADDAVFAPAPIAPGQAATARFVLVIGPTHPCPDLAIPLNLSITSAAGCAASLPFALALTSCTGGATVTLPPLEVPNTSVRVTKVQASPDALRIDWAAVSVPAATYNVFRGWIFDLARPSGYTHVASLTLGIGACTVLDLFTSRPDVADPGSFYYVVTSELPCGLEGTTGFDSLANERPAGGGCP